MRTGSMRGVVMDERTKEWPIACKCGESWTELEWKELPLVGVYDAGQDGKWELRTCVCGATLQIPSSE